MNADTSNWGAADDGKFALISETTETTSHDHGKLYI